MAKDKYGRELVPVDQWGRELVVEPEPFVGPPAPAPAKPAGNVVERVGQRAQELVAKVPGAPAEGSYLDKALKLLVAGPLGPVAGAAAFTPENEAVQAGLWAAGNQGAMGRGPQVLGLEDSVRAAVGTDKEGLHPIEGDVTSIEGLKKLANSTEARLRSLANTKLEFDKAMYTKPVATVEKVIEGFRPASDRYAQASRDMNEKHPVGSFIGQGGMGLVQGLTGGAKGSALTGYLTGSASPNPFADALVDPKESPVANQALQSMLPHPGGVVGGLLGYGGAKAPVKTGLGTGAAVAAFGDALGMNEAEKMQALAGSALAVLGGSIGAYKDHKAAKALKAADAMLEKPAAEAAAARAQVVDKNARLRENAADKLTDKALDGDARLRKASEALANEAKTTQLKYDDDLAKAQVTSKKKADTANAKALEKHKAAEVKAKTSVEKTVKKDQLGTRKEVVSKFLSLLDDNSAEAKAAKLEDAMDNVENVKASQFGILGREAQSDQQAAHLYGKAIKDKAAGGDYKAQLAEMQLQDLESQMGDVGVERMNDIIEMSPKARAEAKTAASLKRAQERLDKLLAQGQEGMSQQEAAAILKKMPDLDPALVDQVTKARLGWKQKMGIAQDPNAQPELPPPPKMVEPEPVPDNPPGVYPLPKPHGWVGPGPDDVQPLSLADARTRALKLLADPTFVQDNFPDIAATDKLPPVPTKAELAQTLSKDVPEADPTHAIMALLRGRPGKAARELISQKPKSKFDEYHDLVKQSQKTGEGARGLGNLRPGELAKLIQWLEEQDGGR